MPVVRFLPTHPDSLTMPVYSPVATDEVDSEKLLAQTTLAAGWSDGDKASPVSVKVKLRRWLPWILHALLLLISLLILVNAYRIGDVQCTKRV